MSEFINFEAEASDSEVSENGEDTDMDSFINDEPESEYASESDTEGANFEFANVSRSIEEVNREIEQNAIARIQNCEDYSNLSNADNDEPEIFEFENDKEHIENSKKH